MSSEKKMKLRMNRSFTQKAIPGPKVKLNELTKREAWQSQKNGRHFLQIDKFILLFLNLSSFPNLVGFFFSFPFSCIVLRITVLDSFDALRFFLILKHLEKYQNYFKNQKTKVAKRLEDLV